MTAMDYSQVAHWYDIYVNTELDVPFFLNEAQNSDPEGICFAGRVLELTSGTGRLSIPLLEAGVSLILWSKVLNSGKYTVAME